MNYLNKDDALLNFCFLTASFYNYVKSSGINFKNIISKCDIIKGNKNENKNNTITNIEKDFDLLNNSNSMNYYENLSLLNNNDEDSKKEKIKLIDSVFGKIIEENQVEKIIYSLTEKINCSMLSDKYLLVKFLSGQIIEYVFLIYELFFKIIKNIEENQNKKIQDIIKDNLLIEDELKKSNKKLSNEIMDLKNIIEIKNQNINNNLKIQEKLIEINKNSESYIKRIKSDMLNIQKEFNNLQDKSKETIELLKFDLKEYKEKEVNYKSKESKNTNEEKANLENELKEPNENFELLFNKIKELKMDSLVNQKEIEKLKKSNNELYKKIEDYYEEKFQNNLNCQITIIGDGNSSKNENLDGQQQKLNIRIKEKDLMRILDQLRKDNKIDNKEIKEKNNG